MVPMLLGHYHWIQHSPRVCCHRHWASAAPEVCGSCCQACAPLHWPASANSIVALGLCGHHHHAQDEVPQCPVLLLNPVYLPVSSNCQGRCVICTSTEKAVLLWEEVNPPMYCFEHLRFSQALWVPQVYRKISLGSMWPWFSYLQMGATGH